MVPPLSSVRVRVAAAVLPAALLALSLADGPAPASAAPRPRAGRAADGVPATIAVSYADLIDPAAVTRTGRRLTEAVRDKSTPRAFLQPFLEGYSSLLPYVVEMVFGPDPVPRRDVVGRWPPGSPQPAWAALFRGRYRAVSDEAGRVRLFLPGDDAAAAWKEHYSAVRHCLAALAGTTGSPLSVEIFAYRNDYRRRELRLSLRPATVGGASFPPERASLDLAALEDFFQQGGQLEGARLDDAEGLVLFANPERRDTLAGEPVALADLAVAYRAVFHAGDNDAFISLDPNGDPGLTSVNFGGYLEDTRLGAAVLAADRRFKTICTGLDPVTQQDARAEIRRRIPEFMTNSERAFLERGAESPAVWVASRYWFYPESVSVDADAREGFAVITRPRFTADAERIGEGFDGLDPRKKRAALPGGARANIRQINEEFARYAEVFPEIGDLAAVARLMAVATWLKRSETGRHDLDALLAVSLPAVSTPRTLGQLISTEYFSVPPSGEVSAAAVKERSGAMSINPMLDRTVGEFFRDLKSYTAWRCALRQAEKRPCSAYEEEAAAQFAEQRNLPVRALLGSKQDLLSILEFLMSRLVYPLPPEGEAARAEQMADRRLLERLRGELERVRGEIAAAGESAPPALVAERGELEAQFAAIMRRYHDGGKAPTGWQTRSRIQINGGISLRPGEFTIRRDGESKALKEFKRRAEAAGTAPGAPGGGKRLVRSRPTGKGAPAVAKAPAPLPAAGGESGSATEKAAAKPVSKPVPNVDPRATARPVAKPSARPPAADGKSPGPALVATRIAVPAGTAGVVQAVGELAADGRIVFRKAP